MPQSNKEKQESLEGILEDLMGWAVLHYDEDTPSKWKDKVNEYAEKIRSHFCEGKIEYKALVRLLLNIKLAIGDEKDEITLYTKRHLYGWIEKYIDMRLRELDQAKSKVKGEEHKK